MKSCLLFFFVLFMMMNKVSAHVDPRVQPVLNFRESLSHTHDGTNLHLKVIEEEVSFPEHKQKERFMKAISLIEDVINSDEFRTKVLSYVRSNGKNEYSQNFVWGQSKTKLTNEEIYAHIMKGDEKMRAGTIGEINLNTTVRVCSGAEKLSSWCRSVIGSTNPYSSKWIELNWKYYSQFKTHQMVGNLVHEWLHLIGFIHGKENMNEEVPYVVGSIASEIAKKMLDAEPSL